MPPNQDPPTPTDSGSLPSAADNPNNGTPVQPQTPAPYVAPTIVQPNNSAQPSAGSPPTVPVPSTAAPINSTPPPETASSYQITPQAGTLPTSALPPEVKSPNNKKKMILAGSALAGVLLLAGGIVFGWYLPNQPQNVYNTGLSRSGKVVDTLVVEATQEEKLKNIPNSELTGSLEFNGPDGNYRGSFNSKYDDKQSDSNFKYEQSGAEGDQDFNVRFLSDLADGKDYADMFFQINGLNKLGLDELAPGISQYEGKWISVPSDYIKSIVPAGEEGPDQKIEFTQKDAGELARIVSGTTREYVFTTKPDKAVLTQKSFVGTEKLEGGITANHYMMGLNKENSKKYCKALTEAFMSADAYKRIPGVDKDKIEEEKKSAVNDCDTNATEEIDDNETFDMWIDKKNKLIHKIRVTDKEQKGSYSEFGQTYTKGDVIPMFASYHSDVDKIDGKITLEYNKKNSTTKGTLNFEMTEGGAGSFDDTTGDVIRNTATETQKYTVKADFEFKPYDGDVTIDKPADTIHIEKVLEALGYDPSGLTGLSEDPSSSRNTRAKDTEREVDIRLIYSELEAYFGENGSYPSLKDINSAPWRDANMLGLDDEALTDPDGVNAVLGAAPNATQYGYAPTGCSATGEGCSGYTLSAIRSDGSKYTKNNLN